MFRFHVGWLRLGCVAAVTLWGVSGGYGLGAEEIPAAETAGELPVNAPEDAKDSAETADGVGVLTRGPIHEAFAQQTDLALKPEITASKKPPAPIEELPPEIRPEGDNVTWIPGYWHWDEERSDFIWISGVWRVAPTGMRWVPGYWTEAGGEYRWVPGVWAGAEKAELDYHPLPPETLEVGPSYEAPSDDHFWIPGCWMFRSERYAWRPGYWTPAVTNRVWVPAYYSWTPGGYLFIDGYWDYPFVDRGTLFCPVYFEPFVYSRPNFCYRPYVALSAPLVFAHLFIRPGCHSYYFGDFYGYHHAGHHYYPWFDFHRVGRCYDPFYVYHSVGHHSDRWGGLGRCRDSYDYYLRHADRRPLHTFADQRRHFDVAGRRNDPHDVMLAHRLTERPLGDDLGHRRYVPLDERNRNDLNRRITDLRELSRNRVRVETDPIASSLSNPQVGGTARGRDRRLQLSRLEGSTVDGSATGRTPPVRSLEGGSSSRGGRQLEVLDAVRNAQDATAARRPPSGRSTDSVRTPSGSESSSSTETASGTFIPSRGRDLPLPSAARSGEDRASERRSELDRLRGSVRTPPGSESTTNPANETASGTLTLPRDRTLPTPGSTRSRENTNLDPRTRFDRALESARAQLQKGGVRGRATESAAPNATPSPRPEIQLPNRGSSDAATAAERRTAFSRPLEMRPESSRPPIGSETRRPETSSDSLRRSLEARARSAGSSERTSPTFSRPESPPPRSESPTRSSSGRLRSLTPGLDRGGSSRLTLPDSSSSGSLGLRSRIAPTPSTSPTPQPRLNTPSRAFGLPDTGSRPSGSLGSGPSVSRGSLGSGPSVSRGSSFGSLSPGRSSSMGEMRSGPSRPGPSASGGFGRGRGDLGAGSGGRGRN